MKYGDVGGAYEWISNNNFTLINTIIGGEGDDLNTVTIFNFHDCIFERPPFKREECDIKVSYIPLSYKCLTPIYIVDNFDLRCYLMAVSYTHLTLPTTPYV